MKCGLLDGLRSVQQIPLQVFLHSLTARTGYPRILAGKVKHSLTIFTPGGDVKLEGEDDVISVAYLTKEATLSAQVALEHVVGGVLHQFEQVSCIFALCYLS